MANSPNVIELDSRRRLPEAGETPLRCAECGGEWFELDGRPAGRPNGAVTMSQDGRVTGRMGVPRCVDCGLLVQ